MTFAAQPQNVQSELDGIASVVVRLDPSPRAAFLAKFRALDLAAVRCVSDGRPSGELLRRQLGSLLLVLSALAVATRRLISRASLHVAGHCFLAFGGSVVLGYVSRSGSLSLLIGTVDRWARHDDYYTLGAP